MIEIGVTQTTRMGCVGSSTADDPRTAGREAVDAALGGVPAREGDLLVLFASVRYDLHALHAHPHGLSGDELALESRILQAADAFAAMTADRPYRTALPVAEAIAELERGSGSQFDPAVVDAFLDVLAAPVAQPA